MVGVDRFALDRRARRFDGGLLAGSPLRLFRLTTAGQRMIDAVVAGRSLPTGHGSLTDRLVACGALHPLPDRSSSPFTAADVTIVTPIYRTPPSLRRELLGPSALIAVDDASPQPVLVDGAQMIRRDVNGGPGAARNSGLAAVGTELVAFLDADVDVPSGWLDALLAHFVDERVALVAPRVAAGEPCAAGSRLVADYETTRSPLDLGADPALITVGGRVSYVPAAAIVCRVSALRAIGGFDESLRTGEDVDLVWRLAANGYRCRYEPRSVVTHQPRPHVKAMLAQRFSYGRSAAALAARHPGALASVRINRWSAAVWAAFLARRPLLAAAIVAGNAATVHRRLRPLPAAESVRLTLAGHLGAGQQLASAVRRVWWPLAAMAVPFSKLARRAVGASAATVLAASVGASRRSRIGPLRHAALTIVDDAAYGWGVWRGTLAERRLDPLLPGYRSPR